MAAFISGLSQTNIDYVSLIGLIVGVIAVIYSVIVHIYAFRVKKRYLSLVRGEKDLDFERLFLQHNQDIEEIKNEMKRMDAILNNHEQRIRNKTSQPVIKRYNAFGEKGNDLSFSIALLNEQGRGVVLSSIYGREESTVFAKPVEQKKSEYKLTGEELEVIENVKLDVTL